MTATVRLLKVIIRPVFIVDDGTDLTEVVTQELIVSAKAWSDYATTEFPAVVAAVEQQIANDTPPAS